jgi:5-methylcytosine-specific restriction endonuclease McrA
VLCRACEAAGCVTLAQEVDHVQPFEGLTDPRRLDPSNLQPLCTRCHRKKTGRYPKARGDV